MTRASAFLDPRLSEYLVAHAQPRDPLLAELVAETHRLYPELDLQVSPDEGALLRMLVRLCGARRAIELGTFTGYSSICVAQGLAPGGRLLCCDVSAKWTAVARRYWELAGLTDRIELHLGPALRIVAGLPAEPRFDFAFVDAEKTEYIDYYEALVSRMAPGGLIAVDNTLGHGKVAGVGELDPRARLMRAFNDHVLADPRTQSVIVPIADGLTLVTVNG
ncbi:MAG: class I SAM-dependent methyltransferase [Candidatus Dormibacteria bacterium]|jgi:caffeoyl-CoA O-methyltransferase|nr:SAM-dependent methyltransferase [Chloroflexota bacterium]HBV95027.1 SAM-dependent methyltransferase [Chloroflexota bacterium]